ncbi:hypothetical protein M405DRAFT_205880 [Rhizopogon salebrosus TDB-379]|nr:hypothetical protein M405DRAFT_205880 [Rhizopogon salebrosus TDB-379]
MQVDGPARFSPVDLPTELCLLILTYAARPISSALALCHVSGIVRRIVLPQLLHTVILSKPDNVLAFMHALHMQGAYAQQEHHLYFDYAAHVRKIWIHATQTVSYDVYKDNIDFSILAPVLLASQSLAISFEDTFLLDGCLEYAWSPHVDLNVDHKRSPLPWSTKTLTLLKDMDFPDFLDSPDSYPLANTAQGRAFLASISRIIIFPSTIADHYEISECCDSGHLLGHRYPLWVDHFPWGSLKSLRTVSMALPHITIPSSVLDPPDEYEEEFHWRNVPVELLTFSAATINLMSSCFWAQKKLDTYSGGGECISSVEVYGEVCYFRLGSILVDVCCFNWEQVWAGLGESENITEL